jgi:F-type H+-transporting ATPase subunit delta
VSLGTTAKQGLVRDIFESRLDPAAMTVVTQAVGHRWTTTRDLGDALEHLGVVAVVRSADADSARLADELFSVGGVVSGNPTLRDALSDPARSEADKAELLHGLLDGKALPATVTLAQQALAGSYRTVSVALAAYQQVAADVHQQKVATVRVARPLSQDERSRLSDSLSRRYQREIHLNMVVDPQVVGGVRVEIGDDVIDGTVLSRLDEARRKLAG